VAGVQQFPPAKPKRTHRRLLAGARRRILQPRVNFLIFSPCFVNLLKRLDTLCQLWTYGDTS
jgi:hypothetical protein